MQACNFSADQGPISWLLPLGSAFAIIILHLGQVLNFCTYCVSKDIRLSKHAHNWKFPANLWRVDSLFTVSRAMKADFVVEKIFKKNSTKSCCVWPFPLFFNTLFNCSCMPVHGRCHLNFSSIVQRKAICLCKLLAQLGNHFQVWLAIQGVTIAM